MLLLAKKKMFRIRLMFYDRMSRIVEARAMSVVPQRRHLLKVSVNSPATFLMLSGNREEEGEAMGLFQAAWLCSCLLSGTNGSVHQPAS